MKTFLSYPSEQLQVARTIYDFLCSMGVRPWFDKESLIAGQDWDRERRIAQRAADLTFLVLSPETVSRPGVIQREVNEILELLQDKPLGHTFLISIRSHDIRVPPELGKYQYIDFFRLGWREGIARAVSLKLEQLGETKPNPLVAFLEARERAQGIHFRALRFHSSDTDLQADYFLYQQVGEYWEYINAEIVSDIMGGFLDAKADASSAERLPGRPYSWVRHAQEYFREGQLVSLQIAAYQYSGGAYPNRGVYTMNFAGADVGKVRLPDLFDHNPEILRVIIDHCNKAYRRHGGEELFSNVIRDDGRRDLWQIIRQWSFSSDGLLISLGEWSDLPHVLGLNQALVPWSALKAKIAAKYKATPLGQFIVSR